MVSNLHSASEPPAPLGEEVTDLFEILGESGSGGMGTVFEARERATGRKVALKMVSSGPGNYARFALEAEVLSRLDHLGIVSYVAYGETALGPWLAMEWLEGETLSDALLRSTLDVRDTLALARAVTDALVVAHASKIVHRDLKPSNLFLVGSSPSRVKILDFGVARLREDRRELTLTNQIVGTPGYMSPEQARGLRNVDARADLFSLGCVLFRALTGHSPFYGPDVLSVLAKLATEDPPPVGELVDDVPEPLERLIVALLAKAPADRPESAEAVRDELVRITALVIDGPPIRRPRRGHDGDSLIECVVLARPPDDGTPVEEHAQTVKMALTDATFAVLRERIAGAGGRLRALGGGALLVHVDEQTSSAGRAQAAARCAGILAEENWQVSIAAGSAEHVPLGDEAALDTTVAASSTNPAASGVSVAIDRASLTLADAKPGEVSVASAASEMEHAFYRELLRSMREPRPAPPSAPRTMRAAVADAEESPPVASSPRSLRTRPRSRAASAALALGGSVLGALAIGAVWMMSGARDRADRDASRSTTTALSPAPAASSTEGPSASASASAERPASIAIPSAAAAPTGAPATPVHVQRPLIPQPPATTLPSATARPSSGPAREKWE